MKPLKMDLPSFQAQLPTLFEKLGNKIFSKSLADLYTETFARPTVAYSEKAILKIQALVAHSTIEIAWHGTVDRIDESHFLITDIFVYPQTCTGATVTTDDAEYINWLHAFPDEIFNKLRFQGHSHVNMGITPSATDDHFYEGCVANLKDDDFYIFGIYNKKDDCYMMIVDKKTQIEYGTKDIDTTIMIDGTPFILYAKEQMEKYTKTPPPLATPISKYYAGPTTIDKGAGSMTAKQIKEEAKKNQKKLNEDVQRNIYDERNYNPDFYRAEIVDGRRVRIHA